MRILLTILLLAIAAPGQAQLSVDTFTTPMMAVTEDEADGFLPAPETITGNRLFGVDDTASSGSINNGMTCTLPTEDGGCILFYDFTTPFDITQGGTLGTMEFVVESLTGELSLALSVVDADTGVTANGVIEGLRVGVNRLPLGDLLAFGGTFDPTRVDGFTVAFVNLVASSSITLSEIRLVGGGGTPVSLDAASSSTFFDPTRDGEGIQFVLLPDGQTVVLTWYTYQNGEQLWLIGSGAISGGTAVLEMVRTEGAQFGTAFLPADVVRSSWGVVEFSVLDCNRVSLQATPSEAGFVPVNLSMTRVVPADCNILSASSPPTDAELGFEFSGTYFDPLRDGEGFQISIEEDGRTLVATWYTYLNGSPVWLIGAGTLSGSEVELEMTITSGASYGPDFRAEDVLRQVWGTVRLSFLDCNTLEVDAAPVLPGYEAIRLLLQKILPAQCQ